MFPNINVGLPNIFGDNSKKIKGTAVLMNKKVVDFNNLNLQVGLNLGLDLVSSVLDDFRQFFGNAISFQLISAVNAETGNKLKGKLGKAAHLEGFLNPIPSVVDGKTAFKVHFDWDEEIGIPGAFVIKNNLLTEFYLVSLTLDDIPNHGSIHFVCNSWIYPASKYKYDRIFFANKTYLPSKTPEPLVLYREQELINLRGDGMGERQEWDRVYDYDVYNDLGWPDFLSSLARPTLGGSSTYPYPRRGRTGRKPSNSDRSTESRLLPGVQNFDIYVPRDERFGHLKLSDFLAYFIKSISQDLRPALESAFKFMSNEFDDFEDVRQLHEGGFQLPTDVLNSISGKMPIPMVKELLRSDGEQFLKYPVPHVVKENKSAWMTDEEFAREMLAGVNPCLISLLQVFPPQSKLDSNVYGDQNSKITKEQLEINLDGLTVDEALNSKRLFILDHHDAFMPYLRRINETSSKAYATRTILFLKDDGTLKPLAIELSLPHPDGDQFGAVSEVYLPADQGVESTIWLLAKAYVSVNDSGYHQLISHWLNTHAVIEPFVIATHRQLSALHPIQKLLFPHYRDTMNINALARQALINAGGVIELSFLPKQYAMEMSSVVYKDWVFPDQALPADLIKRGMAIEDSDSPHGLRLLVEDYPYAVDGLEIWAAIKTWVHDYCSYYYKSDDAVKQDSELQAWWKELVEVGHGDLKEKPWWPKMHNLEDLVETCTIIIWTSSALHAAVNFGQYPYGGHILNRPTLSRRLMPKEGTAEYEEMKTDHQKAFLKTITPKFQTLIDLSVIEILSRHASDEVYLGERDDSKWTSDTKPLEAFKKFGKKLAEIEEKLIKRNKDENLRNRVGPVSMPYTLLFPSSKEGLTARGIPNSISI